MRELIRTMAIPSTEYVLTLSVEQTSCGGPHCLTGTVFLCSRGCHWAASSRQMHQARGVVALFRRTLYYGSNYNGLSNWVISAKQSKS